MQTPFEKRENNIDFIRLSLSILVIFSHSYSIGVSAATPDPLAAILHWQSSLGSTAVDIFFILSGFLITASYERAPSIGSYLAKRIRRIYPAFLVVTLLDLFVVLPLSGGHLASGSRTSQAIDVMLQSLRLREFDYVGAFSSGRGIPAINGSMWSLPLEFWCYVLVIVLGVSGLLRSRRALVVTFAVSMLACLHAAFFHWTLDGAWFERVFGDVYLWARMLPMYLSGVVFYRFRSHLSLRPMWIVTAAAVMAAALLNPYTWRLCLPVAGAYLALALAYHPAIRLHGWSRYGDFSYGTYLYAFPVQQLVMRGIGHPVPAWRLFAIATPITLLCAAGSWYGVERWFLRPASRTGGPAEAAAPWRDAARPGRTGMAGAKGWSKGWSRLGPAQPFSLRAFIARRPLLFAGLLLLALKRVEFAIDGQALFVGDSTAYLRNALGLHLMGHRPFVKIDFLWPTYSVAYSWMLRAVQAPFHSLSAIVALQMALGALSAWLLAFASIRFFRVKVGVALAVAAMFALDPVQAVYEHLVLPETTVMLATAVYVVLASMYVKAPTWRLASGLALAGMALASLNVMYVPVAYGAAVLVPALGWVRREGSGSWVRGLALALIVSVGATAAFQWSLRHITGRVAGGAAAYHYETGFSLLANVSPIVLPSDAPNAELAGLIETQQHGPAPFTRQMRNHQRWEPDGLIAKIRAHDPHDPSIADRGASQIAWHAIRRNKRGYLTMIEETYWDYWEAFRGERVRLDNEDGLTASPVEPSILATIAGGFRGYSISQATGQQTWARRYYVAGGVWNMFLLLVFPVVTGIVLLLRPANVRGAAFLFCWSGLLLIAACMGEPSFRYLHPLSLPGLAALAVAWSDGWVRSKQTGREPAARHRDRLESLTAEVV